LLARKSGTAAENTAGPFAMILYTTPLPFLLAFLAGLIPLAQKLRQRNPHSILITCWIAVVCGRLALPSAVNFDGVRHFLELFPPLAIVAAAPFVWSKRPLIRAPLTTAAIAAMLVPLVRVHPFEAAYWNEFA